MANQAYKLTCSLNYEGAEAGAVINVVKGKTAQKPENPTRSGYSFYGWYSNEECTVPFDFDTVMLGDTTIYASWMDESAAYCEVSYDLNYYGVVPQQYTQIAENGTAARALPFVPEREGFTFAGWFSDPAGSVAYDAQTAVTADTTIYAGWSRNDSSAATYVFEAEETDLTGKTGPGFSGSATEQGMIVVNSSLGASGGKFVSYLYQNGLSLEFYVASSETVNDAVISVSIAAEMDNINFDSNQYQVIVNGEAMSFNSVALLNGASFSDAIVISGVTLNEGANSIVLKTNNTVRPMGDASTYSATAPMVDCVKITTSAVVIWDANYNLQKQY